MLARAAERLFDEEQIAMLREAIGPDDLLIMLLDLPPAAEKAVAAITSALASDDIAQARRAAHILKGCAGTFGAAGLASLACEIELELPSIEAMLQRMPALIETLALTTASLAQVATRGIAGGCER
jgi:HPt (histidine-containing phosphotransfer) domain-containing protein